jgi:hypothetical protein
MWWLFMEFLWLQLWKSWNLFEKKQLTIKIIVVFLMMIFSKIGGDHFKLSVHTLCGFSFYCVWHDTNHVEILSTMFGMAAAQSCTFVQALVCSHQRWFGSWIHHVIWTPIISSINSCITWLVSDICWGWKEEKRSQVVCGYSLKIVF